jgi:hypothetical protein
MRGLPDNVFYDGASAVPWGELNETAFLTAALSELSGAMGESFARLRFFILSVQDGEVEPRSLTDPGLDKVLIFISDESGFVPTGWREAYLAIFKSYLPDDSHSAPIFPFPLGCVRDVPAVPIKPPSDRGLDLFFAGNMNANRLGLYRALHPLYRRLPPAALRVGLSLGHRAGLARAVPRDLSPFFPGSYLHFTAGFKQGLSPAAYGQKLADSRVALCPRGWHSAETFRHYEAMRAGTVVISEPLPSTHFYRGSPVIEVPDWRSGVVRARALLRDPGALDAAHRETVRWWHEVCSEASVARYMAERLRGLL